MNDINTQELNNQRTVQLYKVPVGDVTKLGDYREYADGGLLPCDGTIGEEIIEGDKVWRLLDLGLPKIINQQELEAELNKLKKENKLLEKLLLFPK